VSHSAASQASDNTALLQVHGLKVQLGSGEKLVRAVDGVDLRINRGETFALLGESGCGKSMTALGLMRLLPPVGRVADGEVLLDGIPLLDLPESRMRSERGGRIGMIFQEPMTSLNPVMRVGEQIAESVRLHDPQAKGRVRQRVVELLTQVGIPDPERRATEYPHQLSGGMKQRVMIAIALAGRPQLLIADEPTTALDVTIQAQVLRLLKRLQQETGMAILLITHDLGVVAETADRVAVMYAGQIVETAPVQRFFARPSHPYSRMLFRAVPDAGKRDRPLAVIPGMVPPLHRVFTGCRFVDRCDGATSECERVPPPWLEVEGQGWRCHYRPDEVELGETATTKVATGTGTGQSLLRIDDLKVHFPIRKGLLRRAVGAVKAVDGVSLEIPAGRTLALVGESGCGKTTVGKALLQLIRPTAGSVTFDGTELTRLKGEALRRLRREFQIIFQDPAASMNPRMLVRDIVAEGLLAQGLVKDQAERQKMVAELLDQVGLSAEAADRYPHEFSGGQRQRICVARALALRPRLIVCDEPTSALDVSVQAQVLNLLEELQGRLGLSYLFITHNISVVSYLAHEVAVMYLGRIVEQGPVDRVLSQPGHPYTQALLSAVPVADPEHPHEVIQLGGELPSPANPPAGCHFHPRCPKAEARCREAYPAMTDLGKGQRAACWLVM
jgi:peptide/nickel transport system ATP-binding protein